MRQYTHKMTWISDNAEYNIKIHREDTVEKFISEFRELYDCCHTVSCQKYPLKENEKYYIKAKGVKK